MPSTRRHPRVPFSPAFALLKGPASLDKTAVIALVFQDREELNRAYNRTGVWRRHDSVSACVRSAHLEKTPNSGRSRGQAYIDIGWRQYRDRRDQQPYEERIEERLTVPIQGGSNRPAVLAVLAQAEEMAVIFSIVPQFEDLHALDNLKARLRRGEFPTADGTVLIPIKGLTVFGRFHPVGRFRASTLRA